MICYAYPPIQRQLQDHTNKPGSTLSHWRLLEGSKSFALANNLDGISFSLWFLTHFFMSYTNSCQSSFADSQWPASLSLLNLVAVMFRSCTFFTIHLFHFLVCVLHTYNYSPLWMTLNKYCQVTTSQMSCDCNESKWPAWKTFLSENDVFTVL
jgi:hypothetical protein